MPLAGDDGEPRRKWRDRLERRVLWGGRERTARGSVTLVLLCLVRQKKKKKKLLGGSGRESTHQLGAELLFEPLLVAGQDGGIFQTSDGLRDQHVEAVLHGEHQQRPEDRRRRQTAE